MQNHPIKEEYMDRERVMANRNELKMAKGVEICGESSQTPKECGKIVSQVSFYAKIHFNVVNITTLRL